MGKLNDISNTNIGGNNSNNKVLLKKARLIRSLSDKKYINKSQNYNGKTKDDSNSFKNVNLMVQNSDSLIYTTSISRLLEK